MSNPYKKSKDIEQFSRDQQNIAVEEYQLKIVDAVKDTCWMEYGGLLEDSSYYYCAEYKRGTTEWRIERISKTDYSSSWASGSGDLREAIVRKATHSYTLTI